VKMESMQGGSKITIMAEPEPLEATVGNTALIVVDMMNGFVSTGGFSDKILDLDISRAQGIVDPCKRIISATREKGIKVVYLRMAYRPDLSDAGSPHAASWHKEYGLVLTRQQPAKVKDILVDGTWNTEIIEELKPDPADLVVRKPFFSGFSGTELDVVLKTMDAKFLIFVGVATNVCVGCTVRDAYHLGYFPIVVSDATASLGPEYTHDAEIWNFQFVFGWVTTTETILRSLHVT
jgi:ureidoacrylate peracid hydrolase